MGVGVGIFFLMILSDEDEIRKGQAMFEFSLPLVASSGTGRGNLQN